LKGGAWGATLNRVRPHRGTDWSRYHIERLGLSTRVPTVAAGTVTAVHRKNDHELGLYVEVRDDDDWYWTYCHLDSIDDDVTVGHHLDLREKFAEVGQTGSAADFDHLHLMLSKTKGAVNGGTTYDPVKHIKARLATTTTAGNGSTPIEKDDLDMDAKERTALVEDIASAVWAKQLAGIDGSFTAGTADQMVRDARAGVRTSITKLDQTRADIATVNNNVAKLPVSSVTPAQLTAALKDPGVLAALASSSQTIVLAAIAALPAKIDAQLDDEQKELLAKIAALPVALRQELSAALAS
jgi:hypothetical protein